MLKRSTNFYPTTPGRCPCILWHYNTVIGALPAGPPAFKLRDLVQLWKTIPKPDPDYWNTLEEINKAQPLLRQSPWKR
jgi:hypothetical protein